MFVKTSDTALVERIVSDMSSTPPSVAIGAGEEVINHNLAQALEEIKVPVHCICSNSHSFDLEAARQHSSSFEVVFMSGVGHFMMLEDPSTFNSLLDGIIKELFT